MKNIYVSPHSDDVALSCGGQILADAARSDESLVLNVFTSDRSDAGEGGAHGQLFDSINVTRRREDQAAWAYAQVRTLDLELPEALLRQRFPFALAPRQDDRAAADSLYRTAVELVAAHPQASFHFPAAIGCHVDHLVCRDVALRLLDEGRLERVQLYEDVPYSWLKFLRDAYYGALLRSARFEDNAAPLLRPDGLNLRAYLFGKPVPFPRGRMLFGAVYAAMRVGRFARRSQPTQTYSASLRILPLDAQARADKRALLDHYGSQLPMLFGSEPKQTLDANADCFSREVSVILERS